MGRKNKNPLTKAIFENFSRETHQAMYDEKGRVIDYNKKRKRTNWIPLVVAGGIFAVLCGIIYLPQVFIEKNIRGELIMNPNTSGYLQMQEHLENNKGKDFDSDGLINMDELSQGSDPFFPDSDKDGLFDGADSRPLVTDKNLESIIRAQGTTRKDPYSMNGVILWPDDNESWIHGAVIETKEGFQFTGFSGWAKFPEGKYAYQYIDGKHTLLPYRENANAWHITKDCVVVLTDEKPKDTYRIKLFGWETYLRNGFGEFLSWILPEEGWVTCEKMWLDDTFVDTKTNTYTTFKKVNPNSFGESRFEKYSKSLNELADVYRYIASGKYVMASLLSEEHGECVVEVYGFTESGNLIVSDPQLKSNFGILNVEICCSRAVNEDGTVGEHGWFEYFGCGYNSYAGDKIAFFAVEQ